MKPRLFVLTSLAYVVVTFVTAILWHLVAFRGFYDRIGYFGEEEPIVALGFATIAAQGCLVAYAYPFFQERISAWRDALRVTLVFGITIASIQVVAAAAKHHAPATAEWFLFEGLYFTIQFGLLVPVFARIHR